MIDGSRVTPEEVAQILRLHHVEHWPIGTIANQLRRHHETVERVLMQEGLPVTKQVSRARLSDPYLPFIEETLKKFPRLRASRLWRMARERGYTGSQSTFRALVGGLRPRPQAQAYLRRTVLPAQEAQVDWGHFGKLTIGRATRDLFGFVMVLSYSRLRFVRFSLRAAMPSFLRGHVEAFRFFGGAPRVILYDNLKSAVLEREGDAIRYHPQLLELAGHYRFEPRACAPYRPNEKGRVERAIRDVREGFFAARTFTSIEDLNAQAIAFCSEISNERKVPDNPSKTVVEAFFEEKLRLITLPNDDFPVEETVEVRVGKTPYARFDKNDYSVPHTHVCRSLMVIASDDRVRIVDPQAPGVVLANHLRTFDRDQRIEDPAHLRALVAQKRHAHSSHGTHRLFAAAPSARVMMDRLAEQGENIGSVTVGLLKLLDRVGGEYVERAVAQVVSSGRLHMKAVHHEVDRLRFEAGLPPASLIAVSTDERINVQVKPHSLSTYDRLHERGGSSDGIE